MDFIKLMSAKQKQKGYSDKKMSELTGISEYSYYNLKKYRIYLSKVAYYSISSVLGLNMLSDEEINHIIEENRGIVGTPESNLNIAAECVNPQYLEKMQVELAKLKKTLDKVDEKNKVINSQYIEIEKLKKDLEIYTLKIQEDIKKAYSDGVKEGSEKVKNMKSANQQLFIDSLNREYTDKISKLESALHKIEKQYAYLYRSVEESIKTNVMPNLNNIEKPLLLQKEKLGLIITPELVQNVLVNYYNLGLSIEDICMTLGLKRSVVEDIVMNYIEKDINGEKKYVKRSEK